MTSQTGKETITVHIFPNISKKVEIVSNLSDLQSYYKTALVDLFGEIYSFYCDKVDLKTYALS